MNVVIEELKQRISAIATKVRKYQGRVDGYRQNRLFENNQRQFYREIDREEERCENRNSFGKTWNQSSDHKKDAK